MKTRMVRRWDWNKGLKQCLEALAPVEDPKAWMLTHVFNQRNRRRILTYVAVEDDGCVVGTASVVIEPKLIHNCGTVGHIEDVAVHPLHQGKGIGKLLTQRLLKVCRLHRCYKVILNCNEDKVGFYEKLGFRRHDVGMRMEVC